MVVVLESVGLIRPGALIFIDRILDMCAGGQCHGRWGRLLVYRSL